MKRILLVLLVLFMASSVFAGKRRYGWYFFFMSTYKGKNVSVYVCARHSYEAGIRARDAWLCGIPPPRLPFPKAYRVCVERVQVQKLKIPCSF